MIDWLKLRLPWMPPEKIGGDRLVVINPDGEVQWEKLRPLEVRGSHDSSLRASCCPVTGKLMIDGNPAKFFQGHNLFGADDVHGLAFASLVAVNERASLGAPASLFEQVARQDFELARIDLTRMHETGSRVRARNAVHALDDGRATMRYRGRGTLTRSGTLYFGKHSRRWACKIYCKGDELEAQGHKLPEEILYRARLLEFADGKLRIEFVIRGMELKERGLHHASAWNQTTPAKLFDELLAKMEIPEMIELTEHALQELPPRLRLVHSSWKRGDDLRVTLPRATFYRYRKEMLAHGIDIGVRQSAQMSNVVPLVQIIRCTPVDVPSWAYGTPLYFEPRRIAS